MVPVLFLTMTSCWYGSDDDPVVVGENNTYKGVLLDLDGNPVGGKRIVLRSSFDQHIAEFITDENGQFEGQGVIYNTSLKVGLQNDGNVESSLGGQTFTASNYFTEYTFDYTDYPSGETIEFPPLIYAPISNMTVEIANNTGLNYSADYQFDIGVCLKSFEDNVEISSLCYEEENRTLNFNGEGTGRVGVFAVTGSTITITLSNGNNTITGSFLIDETNQVESMTFN